MLERVTKKFKVESKRLLEKGERGLEARNVAMWMVWESGRRSLREIGELFGGGITPLWRRGFAVLG